MEILEACVDHAAASADYTLYKFVGQFACLNRAFRSHPAVCQVQESRRRATVRYFEATTEEEADAALEAGASFAAPAMHHAVQHNFLRILAEHNVPGTSVDDMYESETPLHLACRTWKYDAASILLERNADPGVVYPCGCTILHHAVRDFEHEFVDLLLDYGADPDAKSVSTGDTMVHTAAKWDNVNALAIIDNFDLDVDYDAVNDDGETALYIAIEENSDGMVDKLVQLGAIPGFREFRLAAVKGALAMFDAMLEHNDLDSETLWKLAIVAEMHGHTAMARAICEY